MVQANKVTCWNRAGFVQKFQAKWSVDGKEYATGWTDYYANPESRSFDLDEYSIPYGANVSVEVAAYMGATKTSDAFSYKRGCGKTANYSVTGATLTFDIKLASDEAVSSIKCINHGGFKMKFCVTWGDKKSGYSEYFFNPSSRTIDLDALDIPNGGEVRIFVNVLWGGSETSKEYVIYNKGCGKTATFEVLGTTLNFTINRI